MSTDHERETRLQFLKLEETDCARLRDFKTLLAPRIDGLLDDFYAHIMRFEQMQALFPSQEILDRARSSQKQHWLERVFSADFGPEYMESVNRIGHDHERVGLEPRWYIAGYCHTLNNMIDIAVRAYSRRPDLLVATVRAINKAVFLDMDLAISIYLDVAKENADRELNRHADEFERSIKGMVEIVAAAATELQSTSKSMESTATETTEQATVVAASAEEASANVQTVAAAAEQLSSSIIEISRQVNQAAGIAGNAVGQAQDTNKDVQGLAEAAQKIGEVVSLINDIANQTNLLALNATIEAARAGDAGKGFAVVASEVKNLANQTAKATGEIADQITGVQAATKEAVEAIKEIGGTISEINEISTSIASAVEEQGAATQEIARNVEQASMGTGGVTENIVTVTKAAGDTGLAASQVLEAAGELSNQAEHLSAEVSSFLENIRNR